MRAPSKITPDDYPDLLAAEDAGIPQRELAARYDCAPSLVARHMKKARLDRDRADHAGTTADQECEQPAPTTPGPVCDILEARIRDPRTSARDLASLTNALARLTAQGEQSADSPLSYLRPMTLILEPGPTVDSERRFRLILRAGRGFIYLSGTEYDLSALDALRGIVCCLARDLGLTPEDLGFSEEDLDAARKRLAMTAPATQP